jgi:hypothetical protein
VKVGREVKEENNETGFKSDNQAPGETNKKGKEKDGIRMALAKTGMK